MLKFGFFVQANDVDCKFYIETIAAISQNYTKQTGFYYE